MPVWRVNVHPDFADTISASEVESAISLLDSLIKQVHPTVTAEARRAVLDRVTTNTARI
jgi:hypothetical protein